MKICVIGTGYVGLVAGAGFADMGNDVTCCDVDAQKIEGLKRGVMPIYEPGLDKLVTHNVAEGRLTFTTDVARRRRRRRGDPARGGHAARARRLGRSVVHLQGAAEQVGDALTGWAVMVTKSTVPVGTGDKIEAIVTQAHQARVRGRVEPRVPQGRRRAQRLHEAGPRRRRRRATSARSRRCARSTRRSPAPPTACW